MTESTLMLILIVDCLNFLLLFILCYSSYLLSFHKCNYYQILLVSSQRFEIMKPRNKQVHLKCTIIQTNHVFSAQTHSIFACSDAIIAL